MGVDKGKEKQYSLMNEAGEQLMTVDRRRGGSMGTKGAATDSQRLVLEQGSRELDGLYNRDNPLDLQLP